MKKRKMWIADDHMVVRSGLRQIAAATKDLAVLGESQDGPATIEAVRQRDMDILLLDLSMPGGGIDLIPQLLQARPSLRIVVLTMHGEPQMAARAVQAGAAGYVTKDAEARVLLEAIRTVAAGGNFMEPRLVDALLFERVGDGEITPDKLTRREREILEQLVAGQAIAAIAAKLGCSPKTVSVHKSRLMRKLGLVSGADLFHYGMRHGLGRK